MRGLRVAGGRGCLALVLSMCIGGAQGQVFAGSQPYPALHFRHLGAEAFPAERAFSGLFQDAQGYLWVSTFFGFHRWDGVRLRSYPRCQQSGTLGHSNGGTLLQGPDGALWAIAEEHLVRIEPETGSSRCWKIPQPAGYRLPITASGSQAVDPQGRPVLATSVGLLRFDPTTQTFQTLFRPQVLEAIPPILLRAESGGYWYAYGQDLWWVPLQGAAKRVHRHAQLEYLDNWPAFRNDSGALCMGRGGRLECMATTGVWFTYQDSLGKPLQRCTTHQLDSQQRVWALCSGQLYRQEHAQRPQMRGIALLNPQRGGVEQLMLDSRGVLWAAVPGGLWLIDTRSLARRFVANARGRADAPQPSEGGLPSLLEDRGGGVWMAGGGVGISRATPEPAPISRQRLPDSFQGRPVSQMVRAMHEDARSSGRVLYVATYDPEPWRLELDARGEVIQAQRLPLAPGPKPPFHSEERCLLSDNRGTLWYGARGGLWRWNEAGRRFERVSLRSPGMGREAAEPTVYQLYERPDGRIWVVSEWGLAPLPEALRASAAGRDSPQPHIQWQSLPLATDWPSNGPIGPSWPDAQGRWWLSTWWGLLRYSPADAKPWRRWQVQDGLGHHVLHGVVERRPGEFWLATRGAGLTRMTGVPSSPQFSVMGMESGLLDSVIYGLLADGAGALWFSHNRGLTRWHPDQGDMRHFGLGDGVQALEFNNGVAHAGASGHLYFGGTHGVNRIAPWAFEVARRSPHLDVERVRVDDKSHAWAQLPAQLPAHTRLLEFSWSSVDADFASDLRVRYQLVGADTEWQSGPSAGHARYVGLAAGRYRFESAVSNDGRNWVAAAPLNFDILLPWWRRPLTLAMASLAVLGLSVEYLRRERRHRRRLEQALCQQRSQLDAQHTELLELRQREAAQAERSTLTRDVHDGLGYNLRRAMQAARHGQAPFGRMLALLEDCMAELHLMVDARHSGDEPLSAYLAQLRYRTQELCDSAQVALHWHTEGLRRAESLGLRARLSLGRLLMEAISNGVRHAQAQELHITIQEAEHPAALRLCIRDNGRGFNTELPERPRGQGLANMQTRATELGAAFSLHSQPGTGTVIELTLPLAAS